MKLRIEPNDEQMACPHDNVICSFADKSGSVWVCSDCELEWEDTSDENNNDLTFNEFG